MARIRSIHDGFFTDERLVTVTSFARLLFLGLGVQADDKGTFEWKPITLKMRIFPADNVDIVSLLSELESIDAIRSYEVDGRQYGAIRNFRRFQRPKTPNDIHPITNDFRNYVGLPNAVSEMDAGNEQPIPREGEIVAQMEDGGGRGGDKGKQSTSDDVDTDVGKKSSKPPYAFEAKTIRLTVTDLLKWKQAFPHISVEAELWSLDEWAGQQPKNKWFVAVSSALAKKEREAMERANFAAANAAAGKPPRPRPDPRI